MSDKPNFFESEVCVSRLHCDTCRARHAGCIWRGALRKAFRLPGVDFDCPEGKAWIDDRVTTDRTDAPLPKPCGGCGKPSQTTASGSPIYNVTESVPETDADTSTSNTEQTPDAQRNPLWDATCPPLYGETRASCMECIEKHIGAAMVLLSETKNGYPHYLLAVGHLHEAEEESQAWPEVAVAIRAARKDLQTTGTMPDLPSLATLIKTAIDNPSLRI
jgi:hypothetical protein